MGSSIAFNQIQDVLHPTMTTIWKNDAGLTAIKRLSSLTSLYLCLIRWQCLCLKTSYYNYDDYNDYSMSVDDCWWTLVAFGFSKINLDYH